MTAEQPPIAKVNLDLNATLQVAMTGVRRAAAFLKISSTCSEPADFSVGTGVAFQFLRVDLSEAELLAAKQEFHIWIIGSCLKELDQYFALFLDKVWETLELSALHGRRVDGLIEINDKFAGDTNCASKVRKLHERLQIAPASNCWVSFSKVRNALTHGAGIVRPRDANVDGRLLRVTWAAPEMILFDGDREIVFRDRPIDTHMVSSTNGVEIGFRMGQMTKDFPVGQRITFTEHELAEICMSYAHAAVRLHDALLAHLKGKLGDQVSIQRSGQQPNLAAAAGEPPRADDRVR